MTAKTLFLGFDGADHAYIDAMMAEGELPALSRLKAHSRVFNFENDPGMGAAQFWSSASIGAGPAYHGHHFYMQFKPETYDVVPNHESSLPDITPFWNTLDEEGYAIGVVDWHRLMPKPMKNGFIVDNWLGHDPLTETVYLPETVRDETRRHFTGDTAGGGFGAFARENADEVRAYFDAILERIDTKTAFCIEKLEQKDWDLFVACFSEAHDVGHYYWHLDDPKHERYDPALAEKTREPLRDCYRRMDAAIGRLLDAAGPDARVFTYGGPGMEMLVSANSAMDEMMRRIDLGYDAPKTATETARQSYRSFVSERLRWKLAPLVRSIRRRFARHHHASRRFFAVPHNDNSGAVRINVKGREKHGIINPGAEYDAVVQEITEAVLTFKNPDTGAPIVKRVVCIPQQFDGPHLEVLPDIFIEWNRDGAPCNFKKIVSGKYGEIEIKDVMRTGDHNASGFYWVPAGYSGAPVTLPEHVTAPLVEAVKAARARATHGSRLHAVTEDVSPVS